VGNHDDDNNDGKRKKPARERVALTRAIMMMKRVDGEDDIKVRVALARVTSDDDNKRGND
jgi:hypothetical protein